MKRLNRIIIIVSGIILLCTLFITRLFYVPQDDLNESGKDRYELFLKLFDKLGYKIKPHYSSLMPEKDNIVILFDYKGKEIPDFTQLLLWAKSGGTLFLAGIGENLDPVYANEISKRTQKGSIISEHPFAKDLLQTEVDVRSCFKLKDDKMPIIMSTKNCPVFVGGNYGEGSIYLLSDSSLITLKNIRKPGIAIVFNNFLKRFYGKSVIIYKNRYGLANNIPVFGVLFMGRMKFVIFQLVFVGLLFIISRGIRFGKPLQYDKFARRSLKTHLIAVGHFYKKAKANKIVENINFSYFIFRLKQILKIKSNIREEKSTLAEKLSHSTKVSKHMIEFLLESETSDSISNILKKERIRSIFIQRIS